MLRNNNFMHKGVAIALATLFLGAASMSFAGDKIKVDPNIPLYTKVSGISGNLGSIGSDTMNNLMTLWGESFAKYYPNVKLQVEGKGSGTAPPALIAGTAQFGPMSRKMRPSLAPSRASTVSTASSPTDIRRT